MDDELIVIGSEIKALGNGKLGGYLVRFSTDADPDLEGDFFDAKTDLRFPAELDTYYHHGMDETIKKRVIGKTSITINDAGAWAETQLNMRDEYEKAIYQMGEAGKLGYSSGALAHLVERETAGKATHIKTWVIGEASLTPTPAEPRNTVISLKSYLSGNTQPAETQVEAEAEPTAQTPTNDAGQSQTGVMKMEIDDTKLQEMLDKATDNAVKAFIQTQPSKSTPDIQVTGDEADRAAAGNPFKSAQDFFTAVKNAGMYPSETDRRLLPIKATGLNEAIPSQGGFLVPPETAAGILEGMYNQGALLSYFNPIPVQGNGMTFNAVAETSRADGSRWGGVQGYWLAEAGTKTASKPAFRQVELKLKKVAALVVATDELLEDAGALTAWITRTVPQELQFKIEDSIFNGSGAGMPYGILQSPALKTVANRTDANLISASDIGKMWGSRAAEYKDYIWAINPRLFGSLLNLVIGTTPVFLPAGGLNGMPYATLLGRPLVECEYLPALGTAGDITLVSPSAYPMITKSGVQAASSIHVYFSSDETAFRFVYRVDGAPSWTSARTEKDATTTSPFVVMSATS